MRTANMLISCVDKPGIIHSVTGFLYQNQANISLLEQHIEDGMFFMRVEWQLENFLLDRKSFEESFSNLQKKYEMNICLDFAERKKRMGIFCSKESHCLIDVLARSQMGELDIEISFVISNFGDCRSFVEKFDIPFYCISTKTSDYESKQQELLAKYPTDFLVLARYMKVLSPDFIEKAAQDIINVHHSFLPSFIGARPYDEAYERGVKLIGATSHYVTQELDQGPIIEQTVRRIKHNHSSSHLKVLGRESEKEVFAFAIKKHIENKIIIYKNRTIIFE